MHHVRHRLALLAAWIAVACSAPDRAMPPRELLPPPAAAAAALPAAPGLRLPDGVTPLFYDLTLDVDPDRDTFSGEVRIRVRLDRASDHVWIHADQLEITSARYSGGPLTALPVPGDQMRGFGFGRTLPAGEVELAFAYQGRTTGDQEGLFRQQRDGRWYLFSQGQAVFARRITPCFDEPRFKTPWRVTLVVPRDHVALANAAEVETVVAGDRKRITFGESPAMASYLLAVAVGPFDLVEVGRVGRRKLPVRVAVRAGGGRQVTVVARELPAIVDALEAYVGEPLPLAKLDLVGVPEFFGAMENPGLVTFEESMLIGRPSKGRAEGFTQVAAHELAHQWFGNSVTPAWWDDLWLSESFASWLGDKVARARGALSDGLHDVLERRSALEADRGTDALPLRRTIRTNADPDATFDAIAYQKGEAVIATFEALLGEDVMRSAVRGYLQAHRDGTATAGDLVAALARATQPEVGRAFEQYATRAGVPVVDLALRCDGKPAVVASARDQRLVPACIRYAGSKARTCALVGEHAELAVGATCPAWVDGNASGGYYVVSWRDHSPTRWLAQLPAEARVRVGDDLAAALERGELPANDAIAALRAMLAGHDGYAQLGAVVLAMEIDALVDDATRPAWAAWLARHLPSASDLRKARGPARDALRELANLLPPERMHPGLVKRARGRVDKAISSDSPPPPELVRLAAVGNGDGIFDRVLERARATGDSEQRERWLRTLGELPPAFAERIAALPTAMGELPVEPIWSALADFFARPAARTAAWRALRGHLATFVERAAHRATDMIGAAASLCDPTSRDDVSTAFAPYLARIPDGRAHLARALASIDACIARRAKLGDLAAAIAVSR